MDRWLYSERRAVCRQPPIDSKGSPAFREAFAPDTFVSMTLYIQFDGQQLTFRTNVEKVADFVAKTFRHMLVSESTIPAGSLEFFRTSAGYSLKTADVFEFPEIELAELVPLVKDEVRLQFMRARPDLLWMHAGVVEHDGAVLIAGKSGQGKSTMTTRLCEYGWHFLSDDVAPVRMSADRVIPFPQAPVRRLHPGREVSSDELGTLAREAIDLNPEMISRDEAEIRCIVFIEYDAGSRATLKRLDQGTAAMEILRNATNFFDHRAAAVERAVRLVSRAPMYRLQYGSADEAAAAVARIDHDS
jgi:hypothetical protein